MSTARSRKAAPLAAENENLRREIEALKSRLGPAGRPPVPQLVGEAWNQAFADLLPDAVYVHLLADARIVTINRAGLRQLGAERAEEVIGRLNLDFVGQEFHDDTRAHMSAASSGRAQTVYLKRRRLRVDGTDYPAEVTASPIYWQGEPAMLVVVRDLTEVEGNARALRSLRDQLAEAVDQVSEGFALFDAEERFVFANVRYMAGDPGRNELLKPGVTFETFITRTLERNPTALLEGTDIGAEVRKRLAWFRSGGSSNEFQDGSGRWFLVSHSRLSSGATVIMISDISARKRIEQEVAERAEQLRTVLQNSPFGIYVRKGGKFVLVNRALTRMLGAASPEDLIGRDTLEFIHPEDRATVARRMAEGSKVDAAGEPFGQRYMRLDGEYIWTEATPTPIEWEGERGALVFLRDSTARKQLRAAYDRQQAVLREALESIREGIWVFDGDQRLVIANDRVREFLDLPADFLKPGVRFDEVMRYCIDRGDDGEGDPDEQLALRLETSRTRVPRTFERAGPNGRTFEVRYAPMPGGGLVATRVDVTERKEFDRSLEDLTVRLLAQSRNLKRSNEELEQFAYIASHDLQEPLRSISGYCQLLQRRYKGRFDQDADDFIQFAVEGAQRMQLLISDLLRYSRVGTHGKPFTPTDCNKVAADALANLDEAIRESGAEVSCADLPVVEGDAVQLGQLFQNLIANAIKFRAETPPRIRVAAETIDGETVFSVADNGIGIDARHQERIFQIFQRLHERGRYPGTGIGLAVCKKIVERHGGRIWVESAPGEGATFRFTLARKEFGIEESPQ